MKYEITKEQIETLVDVSKNAEIRLKEWFPEAFKTVLEVGKWYKTKFVFINITNIDAKGKVYGYGWDLCSEIWHGSDNDDWGVDNAIEATESEVFEALKKEAINRGYKNGNFKCLLMPDFTHKVMNNFHFQDNMLFHGESNVHKNNVIFKDGQWAEIIETITKKEAEKLLNKKII